MLQRNICIYTSIFFSSVPKTQIFVMLILNEWFNKEKEYCNGENDFKLKISLYISPAPYTHTTGRFREHWSDSQSNVFLCVPWSNIMAYV